jgi:D-amino-acid dehydrogenase
MKVVVLGGGVIGVSSAWYLARLGHEVELIERQPGVALETSFANAGQVSPGYSTPWAAPGLPRKAIGWMLRKHSPLQIRARFDIAMMRWMAALLANCTEEAYDRNKSRMLRLAEYSRDCLDDLRHETGITYDDGQKGLIQLFRTQAQLDHAADDMRILAESGVPHALLDRAGVVAHEPGLAHAAHRLKGGLRLPGDQSGDAHLFTRRLADKAREAGVTFRLGVGIERLLHGPDRIDGVVTSQGTITADAYLAATGVHTARLLRPLGLRLPVYPVKGYSLTIPLTDATRAPTSTVNDETYKVAMTRLGDRIRVGGTAELAGYDLTLRPERRETLELSFGDLFGGGDLSRATYWTGLRPNTPDGTPIVGSSGRYRNLWLNTGHGTLGWTMAAGSGRLIADLISGQRPNIEYADLALSRYDIPSRRTASREPLVPA